MALKKVALLLKNTLAEAKELLSGDEHGMILLGVEAELTRLINKFAFLSNTAIDPQKGEEFKPVTEFFGEQINVQKEVPEEAFTPTEANKNAFVEKVDQLQELLQTGSTAETILNGYTLKDDQLVIRGVAKRAGVLDYKEKAINLTFIQEIIEALELKAEDEQRQRLIDEANKDNGTVGGADGTLGTGTDDEDEDTTGDQDKSNDTGGTNTNGSTEPAIVKPLSKWNKAELQAELTKREIEFDPEATNKVLVEMIEQAISKEEEESNS